MKAVINGRAMWQMREVSGQTAARAQNPLNARFGLGNATIVDSIKVEWPSGEVQYGEGLEVNQFLQVREGDGPVVSEELSSFSANLQGRTVVLTWDVASAMKFVGFNIERRVLQNSKTDKDWSKIGSIQGTAANNTTSQYSFVDSFSELIPGRYSYRLKLIERDGAFRYSDEISVDVSAPQEFSLSPNYPNPFNPSTTFEYGLPKTSHIVIRIYDVMGRVIRILINKKQDAGLYSITWDGKDERGIPVSTVVYLISMKSDRFSTFRKILFLK